MTNTNKLLADFNRYFTSGNDVDVPERVSVPRDEWRELHAALAQSGQGEAAATAWAVYDSQGFYELHVCENTAAKWCDKYNARDVDPLKPYTYRKCQLFEPSPQPSHAVAAIRARLAQEEVQVPKRSDKQDDDFASGLRSGLRIALEMLEEEAQPARVLAQPPENSNEDFLTDVYEQCCALIKPLVDAGKLPGSLVESLQILVSREAQPSEPIGWAVFAPDGEWTPYGSENAAKQGAERMNAHDSGYSYGPVFGAAQPTVGTPEAMKIVIEAMRVDPDYAWSWHCNVAMAFVDEGGEPVLANHAAARFMRLLANVEPAHELPAREEAQPARVVDALRECLAQEEGNDDDFASGLRSGLRIALDLLSAPTASKEEKAAQVVGTVTGYRSANGLQQWQFSPSLGAAGLENQRFEVALSTSTAAPTPSQAADGWSAAREQDSSDYSREHLAGEQQAAVTELVDSLSNVEKEYELLAAMRNIELRRPRRSFGIRVMSDELAVEWQVLDKRLDGLIDARRRTLSAYAKKAGA